MWSKSSEENESARKVIGTLLAKKRRAMRQVEEREDNTRFINGFIARAQWDILVEGHDTKRLMALAVLVEEMDRSWCSRFIFLRIFQRNSECVMYCYGGKPNQKAIYVHDHVIHIILMIKSNLENMPFKPSEQKINARILVRLLFSKPRKIGLFIDILFEVRTWRDYCIRRIRNAHPWSCYRSSKDQWNLWGFKNDVCRKDT